jgi:tripeptidyl-peptidase-2
MKVHVESLLSIFSTGSGDVDTSTVVEADEDGYIIGASGARLQINQEWKNPTGKWRVGSKLAFSLFTNELTPRLKTERKKKFDEKQREVVTAALRELTAFDLVCTENFPACFLIFHFVYFPN